MLELERKFTPIKKEIVVVDDEENLDVMPLSDRLQLDAGYGDIGDKVSETGSKASSDLTSSSLYSFEYQVELHKQNNLFHRLKNVKVSFGFLGKNYFCLKTHLYRFSKSTYQ